MIVVDYAAKSEELSHFCPHYNRVDAEGSNFVKFKSGLCPEIQELTPLQEIFHFSILVDKCRIYDEDSRA